MFFSENYRPFYKTNRKQENDSRFSWFLTHLVILMKSVSHHKLGALELKNLVEISLFTLEM